MITEIFISEQELGNVLRTAYVQVGQSIHLCTIPAGATILKAEKDKKRGGFVIVYSEPGDDVTLSIGVRGAICHD